MRRTSTFKISRLASRTLALLLFAVVTLAVDSVANAQVKAESEPEKEALIALDQGFALTGTWSLTITPDDGSPAFVGYYSFFADGNASFSSAGPPIPALGNPGYGVWKKLTVNRFAATIHMNSYNEAFQFDGKLKISAKIRMTDPDTFVTDDTVKVYDPLGNEIVTLGGSAVGKRIKVEN